MESSGRSSANPAVTEAGAGPCASSLLTRAIRDSPKAASDRGEGADELVTAVTEDQVGGSQVGAERVGHLDQQLVAGCVALSVVDGLEAINIDEADHKWLLRAPGPCDLAIQRQEARAAAGHAGEGVD